MYRARLALLPPFAVLSCTLLASANGRRVSDLAELNAALASATPGETIVLAEGTWRDAPVTIARGGAPDAPLTLRAEAPGRSVFTGSSSLTLAAPHVVVEGICFSSGSLTEGSVITFASDHCRVTNSAIINYNPADVATPYYWVYFNGNYNRLDHSFFKGKSHQQPLVGNDHTDSRHNKVDHCHFKDVPYVPNRNGREIFRIWGYGGSEEMGDDGAYFTIERNLFEHADGEGMEIISLKSNRNIVRDNTIVRTRGGITNRSGNFNTITGNVILCDGYPGAYGMRITGQSHTITNNTVRGGEYGIHLMAGEFIDRDLTGSYSPILREGTPLGRVPRYNQPKNNRIAGNTLIENTGADFFIGLAYKSGWPQSQRILLPEGNRFEDNLVVKPRGGVAFAGATPDATPPLDGFTFGPNHFSGNRVFGGTVGFEPPAEGIDILATAPVPAGDGDTLRPHSPGDVGPDWLGAASR